MGCEVGKAKEWQSLFVKGYRRQRTQIGFVDIGELGTASAVHMQVCIHVGVRENHAVNRGKLLLILSGHIPWEPEAAG